MFLRTNVPLIYAIRLITIGETLKLVFYSEKKKLKYFKGFFFLSEILLYQHNLLYRANIIDYSISAPLPSLDISVIDRLSCH